MSKNSWKLIAAGLMAVLLLAIVLVRNFVVGGSVLPTRDSMSSPLEPSTGDTMAVMSESIVGDRGQPYGKAEMPEPPKVPDLVMGCEGECCGFIASHKFLAITRLLSGPEPGATVVKELKIGEEFAKAEAYVRHVEHGEAIMGKQESDSLSAPEIADLKPDDKVSVLHYEGEGFFLVWAKGRLRTVEIMDDSPLQLSRGPKTESWVKFTLPSGEIGWALSPELEWNGCG